ncbi:uncharacterized protein PFL1_00026 [Pseudozyma flocculosa PF-1]|uniref:uncharacterized protein n=1 Tax=Pseudozyma flocculosa PF-1 TaxID=1277687 RepID=UPI0004561B42|nr:uncharacterized protein PFL1_00026 [Pseudozyma flocculosa PF-1]EPQ31827.1 hypothetical protein PFL1_00026 [Pseudozyma flocculosa PF-1]
MACATTAGAAAALQVSEKRRRGGRCGRVGARAEQAAEADAGRAKRVKLGEHRHRRQRNGRLVRLRRTRHRGRLGVVARRHRQLVQHPQPALGHLEARPAVRHAVKDVGEARQILERARRVLAVGAQKDDVRPHHHRLVRVEGDLPKHRRPGPSEELRHHPLRFGDLAQVARAGAEARFVDPVLITAAAGLALAAGGRRAAHGRGGAPAVLGRSSGGIVAIGRGAGEQVGAVERQQDVADLDGQVARLVHLHQALDVEVDAGHLEVADGLVVVAARAKGVERVAGVDVVLGRDVGIPRLDALGERVNLPLRPRVVLVLVEAGAGKLAQLALERGKVAARGAGRGGEAGVEAGDAERPTKDAREDDVLVHNGPPEAAADVLLGVVPVGPDAVRIDMEANRLGLARQAAQQRPKVARPLRVEQVGADQQLRVDRLQRRRAEERAEPQRLVRGREVDVREELGRPGLATDARQHARGMRSGALGPAVVVRRRRRGGARGSRRVGAADEGVDVLLPAVLVGRDDGVLQVAVDAHGADHQKHGEPGQGHARLLLARQPRELAGVLDGAGHRQRGAHCRKVAHKRLADGVELVGRRKEG